MSCFFVATIIMQNEPQEEQQQQQKNLQQQLPVKFFVQRLISYEALKRT